MRIPITARRRFASLLVCLVALALAGCVPIAPVAPATATQPPAPADTAAPPTVTPAPAAPVETAPTDAPAVSAEDIPTGVTAEGYFYRGNPDAPVELVEWSDFECPFCARHAAETGPALDAQYISTGRMLHIFRNFPLSFHPNAQPAALAAYCAGQSDPQYFWGMHDWLFANQAVWASSEDAPVQFRAQALALGVPEADFDACLTGPEATVAIGDDLAEGAQLQIAGTPAFYVNDWFLGGAYPLEAFEEAIGKAEQGIHPPPTPTPLPEGVAPYDSDPNRPGITYDGSPVRGEPDARLVLVTFSDFKCIECLNHFEIVEPALVSKYIDAGEMREVFKFMSYVGPHAAAASLCALEQGKFWEFHDVLFEQQDAWDDAEPASLLAQADRAGVDTVLLDKCIQEEKYRTQVGERDEPGTGVGIPGGAVVRPD